MEFLFNTVFKLKDTKEPVPFSAIPEPLKKDFLTFIEGKTLIKKDSELMVQAHDFKDWLRKLNTKGVDYEIDLNAYESSSE